MNQEIFSLRRDSADLQPLLYEGEMLKYGEPWVALPRELVSGAKGIEAVVFEVVRRETMVRPSRIKIFWKAIRPESLTLTISPALGVMAYGFYRGWDTLWVTGLLAVLGAVLFQISVNLLNDAEDHLRLIDLLGSQGGSRVIQNGWLNARQVKNLAYMALTTGVLLGLPAVLHSPQVLLWIGGAATLGVLVYSNQPFGVKYRPLGGFTLFLLGGVLLTIGISLAVFGRLDWGVACLGVCFGFAALGMNHAGNFQDIETDQGSHVNTLALKVGFNSARHFFPLFYGMAYGALILGIALGELPPLLGLAVSSTLPGLVLFLQKTYKASGPASALLATIRKDSLRIHLVFGVAIILEFLVLAFV